MRPMLAAKTPKDISSLPYPHYASPKLDGIRCIIRDGVAYSRSLKPIRNVAVQATLGNPRLNGLDGELIVGEPNASDCMRVTNSGIMSISKDVPWKFYVFDIWNRPGIQYHQVLEELTRFSDHPSISIIPQTRITSAKQLEQYETRVLDEGYEGAIVRRIDGHYKFGRSTAREGYLIKLKRYEEDEGKIVGFEPWRTNENDPQLNALGYIERSSAKAGKVELDMLGAFMVDGPSPYYEQTVRFGVGTGFTIDERIEFWRRRFELLNHPITYKYFPLGSKERPRQAVFVKLRSPDDM